MNLNEGRGQRRGRQPRMNQELPKVKMVNWAFTGFDYKVSTSTLLNYFEIT